MTIDKDSAIGAAYLGIAFFHAAELMGYEGEVFVVVLDLVLSAAHWFKGGGPPDRQATRELERFQPWCGPLGVAIDGVDTVVTTLRPEAKPPIMRIVGASPDPAADGAPQVFGASFPTFLAESMLTDPRIPECQSGEWITMAKNTTFYIDKCIVDAT